MEPISDTIWFLFFGTLSTLILIALVNEILFLRLLTFKDVARADPIAVIMYSIGGIIGIFDEVFFKFGRAGNIIVLLWALFSYTFIVVYNSNLRAFIIGQEFEQVPDVLEDIDFLNTDKHIMVTTGANIYLEGSTVIAF